MKSIIGLIVALLSILGGAVFTLSAQSSHATEAIIYKNPNCGCCENYADYLRDHGYKVTVKPTHELSAMSREHGVPDELQGCHLGLIDGYVVSGHVPVSIVDRLLKERPAIKGVTLAGMPLGSPGMGGTKNEPWKIYAVGEGEPKLYATE